MNKHFTPSTNIKIDYNESFRIINEHKVYMLLEAHAGKPEFSYFMRTIGGEIANNSKY